MENSTAIVAESGWFLFLRWACVLSLGIAILLLDFHTLPAPVKETATGFSARRAAADIAQISTEPHPVGSASHERTRQVIVEKLQDLGLVPSIQQSVGITEVANLVIATPVQNIITCVRGSASSDSVLLTAHYDSVQTGPGASDDGAGVATILDTLRVLRHEAPLQNDLVVVFTDGEEHGMAGAEAFASTFLQGNWQSLCSPPRVVLNFDNRGDRGPVYMFETGSHNAGLVRAYAQTPEPYGSSLLAAAYDLIPNNTDFSVFKNAGLPGLNFAMADGFETYHTALDTADRVNLRSVQQIGSNLVALLHHLGDAPLDRFTGTVDNAIFFNPLTGWMVHYPMSWTWPLEIVSGILLLFFLYLCRNELHPPAVLGALLATPLACIVTAALTGFGTQLLLRQFSHRLLAGQTTSNLLLLCSLGIASLAVGSVLRCACQSLISAPARAAGMVLLLWTLSLLATLRLPGSSFLFIWPALWLLLVNTLRRLSRWSASGPWGRLAKDAVTILPALLLFLPLLWQAYVLLGIGYPVAGFIGVLLTLLVFAPSDHPAPQSSRWRFTLWTAASLAAGSAFLLLAGFSLSHFTAASPQRDSLAFAVDMDTKEAAWISFDPVVDAWTSRVLGLHPLRASRPDLLGDTFGEVLTKSAPFREEQTMAVASQRSESGTARVLQLHLQPNTPGERLQLTWKADHPLAALTIGERVVDINVGNHQLGNLGLQTAPNRVELFGVPAEGVHVTLAWRADPPRQITLLEFLSGLNALKTSATNISPTGVLASPRPAESIPASGDDITYILRTLSF